MTVEECWRDHHGALLRYGGAVGTFRHKEDPDWFEDVQAAARDLALEGFDLGFTARLDCSTGRYGMPSPAACIHHGGERVCRAAAERVRLEALGQPAEEGGR